MVWPARAATCNRVLITSAGVTKDAAGIPAANTTRRSLVTFSLYKNNCAFNWWPWKESEASDEIKGLFHCPLRGAPPRLSRVQRRRLNIPIHTHHPFSKLPAYICYIYILSWYWGTIYQWHYFKWWVVQNQWRSFFFLLSHWNQKREKLLGSIFQRWSLLCVSSSCFSVAAGRHRRCLLSHFRPPDPPNPDSPVTPKKDLTECWPSILWVRVRARVCVLGVEAGVASGGDSRR